MRTRPFLAIAAGFMTAAAWAHVPILLDGSHATPDHAASLSDVQISRALYAELTPASPQTWISFSVNEPQSLKLTLGIPYIPRLESFRPSVALLGAKLPAGDLPFYAPPGTGVLILDTNAISSPPVELEPFSGTQSWILLDTELHLPAAGNYYLVAFSPANDAGKYWLALGEKEQFTPEQIQNLRSDVAAVRNYFEVGPEAAPPCFLFAIAALTLGILPFWVRQRRPDRRKALRESRSN